MNAPRAVLHTGARLAAAALLLGCGDAPELDPQAFCARLEALAAGRIPLPEGPNELAGHVAALASLREVAPADLADPLKQLHDVLRSARDAGGFRTLLRFQQLTEPALAGAEGRIAAYAARHCRFDFGDPAYRVGAGGRPESACPGWPQPGSPLTNNRFPYLLDTSAANYFGTLFWSVPLLPAPPGMIRVPRGGRVELRGVYPRARYFAFHPNDVETNNLDTLVDVELDPDPGSANPFRDVPGPEPGRAYTATLVFSAPPAEPASNTSYVGRRAEGGFNPAVFLIYRIYGSELGGLPPNSAGAPLPAIHVFDADGEPLQHFDACDPYPPGFQPPVSDTRFPAFPLADHRAVHQPGELSTHPAWGLPVDLLSNADVLYLSAPYARRQGEIFALRARDPRRQIRMWSACSYNFWNGAANACVMDSEVALDAEGFYTLLVSREEDRPRNAVAELGATWLDAGHFLDGQLSLRLLLSSHPLLQQLRRAVDEGHAAPEVAPYVPQVAFCSRARWEQGGWNACRTESVATR